MHLLPQKDLKVFVLDRGMDIFVPVFIWPTPIKSIEINQNTLLMDMRVTKNIFIKNDHKCEGNKDYVYTGIYDFLEDGINMSFCLTLKSQIVLQKSSCFTPDCVAKEFVAFYSQIEEDCTLPWTISLMTTATNMTEKEDPCKDEKISNSKTLMIQDFFMRARGYELENCKGDF